VTVRISSLLALGVVVPALASCAHRDIAPRPALMSGNVVDCKVVGAQCPLVVDECPIVGATTHRTACSYGVEAVYGPVTCYCAEGQFGARHWVCPVAEWAYCPFETRW
jgi:hypothetical protein